MRCTCGDGKMHVTVTVLLLRATTLTRAIMYFTHYMVITYYIEFRRMWALDSLLYNILCMLIHALKKEFKKGTLKTMTGVVKGTVHCL